MFQFKNALRNNINFNELQNMLSPEDLGVVKRYLDYEAYQIELMLGDQIGFSPSFMARVSEEVRDLWKVEDYREYLENESIRAIIDGMRILEITTPR